MTLKYSMQLADEVPMMWTSLVILFCSLEVVNVGKTNTWLIFGLTLYGVTGTLIYITIQEPVIFQTCYAIAVLAMIGLDFMLAYQGQGNSIVFWWAMGLFVFGFCLWNIDNHMCSYLHLGRSKLPFPVRPLTQLHAWWHILAGIGSYLHMLFCIQARCNILKRETALQVSWLGLTLRCKDTSKLE